MPQPPPQVASQGHYGGREVILWWPWGDLKVTSRSPSRFLPCLVCLENRKAAHRERTPCDCLAVTVRAPCDLLIDEFQINEINVDLRTSGFDNEVLSVDACAVWWERESFYCLPRIGVVTWHREPRFQCGSARTGSIWNLSIGALRSPHGILFHDFYDCRADLVTFVNTASAARKAVRFVKIPYTNRRTVRRQASYVT